jgi:hypothetical protein
MIRMISHAKQGEKGKTCNTNVEKRNAYRIFVGKPEKKEIAKKTRTFGGE